MSLLFKYLKNAGDKQYRIVSLMNETIGEWTDFQGETAEYPEQCVLEVRHSDDTCTVEYGRATRVVSVGRDGNLLYLASEIPTARLWVRGGKGMAYKVPSTLMQKDGNAYLLIPGGTQNVVLFGDEYFSKAYSLTMG